MNLEELKTKLRTYNKEEITFNEPHFSQKLLFREGNRETVIKNVLCPDKLVYFYEEFGKYGDIKYNLYFEIEKLKTMKIPIILDKNCKRNIYIITYIISYRRWQGMVKRK